MPPSMNEAFVIPLIKMAWRIIFLSSSGLQESHSTDTALVRVQNDLLRAIDTDAWGYVGFAWLFTAYDTVDHKVLQKILDKRVEVVDIALQRSKSYISYRRQSVYTDGTASENEELQYNGPIPYVIYTSPLGDIARSHNLDVHLYTDDTQMYEGYDSACIAGSRCISAITFWMNAHFLKLNHDKTLLFGLPEYISNKLRKV